MCVTGALRDFARAKRPAVWVRASRERRGAVKHTREGFAEAEEGHASERQPRATAEPAGFRARSRGPLGGVTAEFVVWMSYAPGDAGPPTFRASALPVRFIE